MFPLSCARVRTHTGRETSAHKKTWSAQQNFPSKKYLHIFYAHHPIYRRVLVDVAQKKFYAHTDFIKLEGTSFSTLLKLNLFGWVVDWRMLIDAWSLKPFLILSSVILSVTLGSSLTKNLTFQYTLINLPVVATINFSSCVLFPVPYLMMQLLPWSML